jgi:hypothetical protein
MSALPARKLDPESDKDRASSRIWRALKGVGAKKKVVSREGSLPRVHPRGVVSKDSKEGRSIPFFGGRQKAANGNAGGSHESEQKAPGTKLNVQRPTPRAHRPGAAGPQHVNPPISAAIQLHANQVRDRFGGGEETAPVSDLPIEGRRAFLESDVRSYSLPEESEGERERRRQEAMLEQAALAFGAETEESRGEGASPSEGMEAEETAPETQTEPRREGPEAATVQSQLRMQAEIQAAQTKVRLEADRKSADSATKTATASAASVMEDIRFKQQIIRIGTEFAASPTVYGFFMGLLDINAMAFKMQLNPNSDIPFLYTKTTKPHITFKAIVLFIDIMLIVLLTIAVMIPITLIITAVVAAVKFDIFSIIYGMFSGLFS